MQATIAGLFIFALAQGAVAGHHEEDENGLHLKPRQATSILNVTSVDVDSDKTTITASGKWVSTVASMSLTTRPNQPTVYLAL
jgi:hypothetical protein|tara:strand:+ start:10530 stop:10778 length:249 start_codon:yes stop_codon:yes gene_type:complete